MSLKTSSTWLTSYSDNDFDSTGNTILTAVKDNPSLPAPVPTIEDLLAMQKHFTDSSAAATDGGKTETAAKNSARLVYAEGLRQLGEYIDKTATTLEQFLSTKYPMQKDRLPVGIQPAPSNLRLRHGKVSGSLDAACDVSDHRVMYEWQTAIGQNPTEWEIQPSTNSSRTTFSGFTPGTWVSVRCRIRVPAGAGDWSSVVQIMMV